MEVNILAVLAATVVTFILGGIWYSPMLFGNVWSKAMGFEVNEMKKKGIWKSYLGNFIAAFVFGYVLAYLLVQTNAKDLLDGLELALWIWLGFIVTQSLGGVFWEKRSFKVFTVNTIYSLVQLCVMATIILWMTL